MTDKDLLQIIKANFNFRPGNMIKELDLKRPFYYKTAKYGAFGRSDPDFTWENPKIAAAIANLLADRQVQMTLQLNREEMKATREYIEARIARST